MMDQDENTKPDGFKVPIAIFNFNRPVLTRRVFEVVRKIKPERLLLVADGPRADRPDDGRLCAEVRNIFDEVDWKCEVSTNFSDTNLGSFKRNSSGLNWVFNTVEEAIILEDDCIPSLSFFPYCQELLDRYRHDLRIGTICGSNFGISRTERNIDSYYYSAYNFTWGWASWRRVWEKIDLSMSWWESERGKEMFQKTFAQTVEWQHWHHLFESIHRGDRENAWDYQLLLSCFRYSQYGVIPRVNLISNIGFGDEATHCVDVDSPLHNLPRGEIEIPLVHPLEVKRSGLSVDRAIFSLFAPPSFSRRVIAKLVKLFKRLIKLFGA